MKNPVPKFALAALVYTVWCALIHVIAAYATPLILGIPDPTSAVPFANAHLLEEAAEGHYHPLASAPVIIYMLVVCLVGFLAGAYFCLALLFRQKIYLTALLPILPVAAMAVMLGFVFTPGYPAAMQLTLVVELLLFLGFGSLGTKLYSLRAATAA